MTPAEGQGADHDIAQTLQAAMQSHGRGDLAAAEAGYKAVLARQPRHPVALQLLGVVAQQSGDTETAIALIKEALKVAPTYAEAHFNLGNVLKAAERLEEAFAAFEQAVALQPSYADAHANLGATLQLLGRHEAALSPCQRAAELQPDNPLAHNNLGAVLHRLNRSDEAESHYRRALSLAPNYAEAHCNLGASLVHFDRLEEGRACFERAIAIKPGYVQAHANLAELFEKANDKEALARAVAEAKRHCPADLRLALREAWLLKREKAYAEARALLEDPALLNAANQQAFDNRYLMARAHLLGDLCDRLDDPAAAFAYFQEGNRLNRESHHAQKFSPEKPMQEVEVLTAQFTAEWVASWRPLTLQDARPDPVFLVGFPRSGTTLLDSILRSHPAVAVVEEAPTLVRLRDRLADLGRSYPDDGRGEGLAALEQSELADLRSAYFAELQRHLEPEEQGRLIIDKLPLNTTQAGLIHRVFPRAKFIFAKRHPCDCVLSCFLREFELNDHMANFLDFERSADFYDKVMSLWQSYRRLLPLEVHEVVYESLIQDFETTLRPLLAFLGLKWDPALHDYAETARRRKRIHTPSYNQVTQPLYQEARYRWERYRKEMTPVLPILEPWARIFGYEA